MEVIIENLEGMVSSYTDPEDPTVLKDQCKLILGAVRENVGEAITMFPDNVAFGIFPYVILTDRGKMFLNQCNMIEGELPTWQEIREQKFFQISGEHDFIRGLPDVEEDVAVQILFAIAIVKEDM